MTSRRTWSRNVVRKAAARAVAHLEPLELRQLLSSSVDVNGLLSVDGTTGDDNISIAVSAGTLTVSLNGNTDGSFLATDVTAIQVNGLAGADSISLAGVAIGATLSGGDGNDTLVGGTASDFLAGNDDDDTFFSNDGNPDTLVGGNGFDTVSAFDSSDSFNTIEAGIPVAVVTVTRGTTTITNGATTPIDFGSVTQGQTGPTRTFTVKNDGTDVLTLGAVSVPAGFTLTDPLVGPLNPGESESFTVQVDTSVAGNKSGTVSFANSDPNQNPFTFAISATVDAAPPQVPEVTVSLGTVTLTPILDGQSAAIDFGSAVQGTTAPTLSFTVTNDGTGVLNLSGLTVPAGYTVVDGLVSSLNPGASDVLTIRLDTSVVGTKSGQVTFSNNDTDEDPFNFTITGVVQSNGTAPGIDATIARPAGPIDDGNSTIEFGNREVGAKAPTRTFRIRNSGNADLTVGDITLPAGFTLLDPLVGPIAPGETESFVVQMDTGGAVGPRDGFVIVPNNASADGTFTFRIRGSVLSVGTGPIPEITVNALQGGQLRGVASSGSSFGFGTFAQGTKLSKAARTFRVSNDGNAVLKMASFKAPAGFVVLDGLSASLQPGQTDLLVIALDTTSTVGAKSGKVTFTDNDLDEGNFSFNLTGTVGQPGAGGTPEVSVSLTNGTPIVDGGASAVSFGTVTQGGTAPTRTFRVKNDGTGTLNVGSVSAPSGFTVIGQLAGPILPGASASFTIRLDSGTVGTKSGQISFTNNDSNESPFNFPIVGTVAAVVGGGPAVAATLSGGVLTVTGTSSIDTISFAAGSKGVTVTGNGKTIGGSPFNGVTKIVVNGNDGDDRIDASTLAIPVTLNGGNGNDTLLGGSASDLLSGGAGNDVLDGGSGNDTLLGGSNNDVLTGGAGLDSLKGDDGNDTLNAADGLADLLVDGGTGTNVVHKDRID